MTQCESPQEVDGQQLPPPLEHITAQRLINEGFKPPPGRKEIQVQGIKFKTIPLTVINTIINKEARNYVQDATSSPFFLKGMTFSEKDSTDTPKNNKT